MDNKNKMDDPWFINEAAVPLVKDEDYDDYKTLDISRIEETSFIEPDTTETTSTLRLRQKVKWNKINAFYRNLIQVLLIWINLWFKKISKAGNTDLLFPDSKSWQFLTNKRTGEFSVAKTLKEKFGGLNVMKSVLSLIKHPLH